MSTEKETVAPDNALTKIPEYSPTAAALVELQNRFKGIVFDVSNGKGMTEAKAARAELRSVRVALEAKRVEIKKPALDRCRDIDTEAKRITAELESLENPIDNLIKAEEQRKEREKAAREEAERQRIIEINQRFDRVRGLVLHGTGKSVAEITDLIAEAEAFDVEDFPEDTKAAARFERQLAVNGLKSLRDQRAAQDQKDIETAEKLKRLEELERQAAERETEERNARHAKALAEEAEQREREAKEAQERAQAEATRQEELRQREAEIAERERVAAEERAEADRLAKAERDRIAAEQAEKHRAAEAAAQAERDRLAAERKRLEEEAARLAAEKEAREIANASLVEAASEALPLLKEGYPRHKATKKLAAALAREQRHAA